MTVSAEESVATAKAFVEKDITDNKVVVYAKSWCPHCKATKELLAISYPDVKPLIRDLDIMDDPSEQCLSKALADMTDQTSVPNIFIDGKHFGGNTDMQKAHNIGKLQSLLS